MYACIILHNMTAITIHAIKFDGILYCKKILLHLWNGTSDKDVNYIASATRKC